MKKWLLLILCICCVSAQILLGQDLRKDEKFLQDSALVEFKNWLEASNLNQVLEVQKLEVNPQRLDLYLSSPLSDRTLIGTWDSLQVHFYEEYERELAEYLFEHFCFQMEVEKEMVNIYIVGQKPNFFTVKIFYENYGVQKQERILKSMGSGSKSILIEDLRKVYRSSKDSVSKRNIKTMQRKIHNYLVKYYESLGTMIGHEAEVDILDESYAEFSFDAWNFSNEVVSDSYFEYVHWTITLAEDDDEIVIKYNLKSKYGSGFFYAPRKSGYKNREPGESDAVQRYEKKMMYQIRKILVE